MPRLLPQADLARRALPSEPSAEMRGGHPPRRRRHRVSRGLVTLGVTVLGLGVTASVATADGAGQLTSRPTASVSAPAGPTVAGAGAGLDRRTNSVDRSAPRPTLGSAALDPVTNVATRSLLTPGQRLQAAARAKAVATRADAVHKAADRAREQADQLERAARDKKQKASKARAAKRRAAAREKAQEQDRADAEKAAAKRAEAKKAAAEKAASRAAAPSRGSAKRAAEQATGAKDSSNGSGHASLPVTSGFHIAARFGATGSWARYHTGIDFAAPKGTPVHAAAAGTVTHAGSGSASWAGHYVTIRHADGKSTLYAHMSTVSVHVGERVSGGQRVGRIGMTGRTFGPHVHFELYPAGVTPGHLYQAINPAPWLHRKGLHY